MYILLLHVFGEIGRVATQIDSQFLCILASAFELTAILWM